MASLSYSLLMGGVAAVSALGLWRFNRALNDLPGWAQPIEKYAQMKERHKWRNAAGSLLKSFVLSLLVTNSFYWYPDLWKNLPYFCCPLMDVTFAFYFGYLGYDLLDLIAHNKLLTTWPLMGHHLLIMYLLAVLFFNQQGMGPLQFGLHCEINAIFLHSRRLLLMHGVSRHGALFCVHGTLNMLTFVFLRMIPISYATYCSLAYEYVPVVAYTTPIGCFMLLLMNAILFKKGFYNGYLRNNKENTRP